jgi:hypothetical protein
LKTEAAAVEKLQLEKERLEASRAKIQVEALLIYLQKKVK